MKNTVPDISVIVPVYNLETYLPKCIDSILSQTFTGFELLLIDDGSSDNSGIICNQYADKDSRIKVFHKSNGGLSSARNCGLNNAKGRWVTFIDSDDYVGERYLQDLFEAIEEGVDLVVQGLSHIKENGEDIPYGFSIPIGKYFYTRSDFKKMFREQHLAMRCHSVSKLFNREFIEANKLRYCEDIYFCEDVLFLYEYLNIDWNRICFSSQSNYFYVDRSTSLVHRKGTFENELRLFRYVNSVVDPFIERGDCDVEDFDSAYFLHRAITVASSIADLKKITHNEWLFFCRYFKCNTKKTILDKWFVEHFYQCPLILLGYFLSVRKFRETLEKGNLWSIIDFLRK